MGKEAAVQTWVRDKLKDEFKSNIYIFKCPQGPYTSRRGISDLIMCICGLFVAIEVKTEEGKLTALQELEITKVREAHGLAFVIYGKDITLLNTIVGMIKDELRNRGYNTL